MNSLLREAREVFESNHIDHDPSDEDMTNVRMDPEELIAFTSFIKAGGWEREVREARDLINETMQADR